MKGSIGTATSTIFSTNIPTKGVFAHKRCSHCGKFKRMTASTKEGINKLPLYYCSQKCARQDENHPNRLVIERTHNSNRYGRKIESRETERAVERFQNVLSEPMPEKPARKLNFLDEGE